MDKLSDLARREQLAREMTHRPLAPIESLRGQDPLTDWALGMRERTLSPLATLAGEAKRFQGLSPQELGMEMVGGGIAGTFIGKGAKTWKAAMKDTAEQLEKQGVSPEEIWKQTGTFRGADKEWRQEIPDDLAALNIGKGNYLKGVTPQSNVGGEYITMPTEQFMAHEDLYKAYPSTRSGNVTIKNYGGRGGQYRDVGGEDFIALHGQLGRRPISKPINDGPWSITQKEADALNAEESALGDWRITSPVETKSIALHELQHAIQQREGWAKGGSPTDMTEEALNMLRRDVESGQISSNKQAIEMLPLAQMNAYKRLAGEAEARLTQARMNMTSEQRLHSYPPSMFDVPMESQIVRY